MEEEVATRNPTKKRNGIRRRRRRRRPVSGHVGAASGEPSGTKVSEQASSDVEVKRSPSRSRSGFREIVDWDPVVEVSPQSTVPAGQDGDTVKSMPTFDDVVAARERRLDELRARIYAAMPLVESAATNDAVVQEVVVDYF